MTQFDTTYSLRLICPHCGKELSDPHEYGDAREIDCPECEKRFEVSRDYDVYYSTRVPVPPRAPRPAPPADFSFRTSVSEPTPRVGDVRLHDTSCNVWEDNVAEEELAEVLHGVLGHLHRRHFAIDRDPQVVDRYPCLANWDWLGMRDRDRLEVHIRLSGRHVQVEFFQNLVTENRNGGRYDQNKFRLMPRSLQVACLTELAGLVALLRRYGYADDPRLQPELPLPLAVRNVVLGQYYDRGDPRAVCRERWRDQSHEELDADGCLARSAYARWSFRDNDGQELVPGAGRLFYCDGRLMRGRVYPDYNGQWLVMFGGDQLRSLPVGYFFSGDPTKLPRRFVRGQLVRLRRELEGALAKRQYHRLEALGRTLARLDREEQPNV